MAIGRKGSASFLNLETIGLTHNNSSGKIIGEEKEKEATNIKGVYGLGDVIEGVMELTPLAIKAGIALANRIYLRKNGQNEEANKRLIDYSLVPTTIFTPLEYSCVGLTEEEAYEKYGEDNLSIFHSKFVPLEESLYKEENSEGDMLRRKAYCKLICEKDGLKVLGVHYLGPNAGEIMQMLGVALKMGFTKHDLDNTIGIHPTIAEEFIQLKKDKVKGENPDKSSC